VALPNKGRLNQPTLEIFEKAGIPLKQNGRELYTSTGSIEAVFVRAKDVPWYVENGFADYGVTGWDRVIESGYDLESVLDLKYSPCKMVLAGEDGSLPGPGERIATSFPNIAQKFFPEAEIIEVSGSVEAMPKLGVADFIVDLTTSGQTIEENNLRVIKTLFESSARLISKDNSNPEFVKKLEASL